jgi:hypothetical protein
VASILLISGVAASRLGLWMFDLSVTQLMQVRNLSLHQLLISTVFLCPRDILDNLETGFRSEMDDIGVGDVTVFLMLALHSAGICTRGRERSSRWRAKVPAVSNGHANLCGWHGDCSPSGK